MFREDEICADINLTPRRWLSALIVIGDQPFCKALLVNSGLSPWHGQRPQAWQTGPRYMWSTFSWRQHRSQAPKRERPIISKLSMGKVIGEGATSKIHEGRFKGGAVAVKALKKRIPEEIRTLAAEYTVLKKLHHPNIIQPIASIFNEYLGLLVLPMCGGGFALVHPKRADLVFKFAAFSFWHAVSFVTHAKSDVVPFGCEAR